MRRLVRTDKGSDLVLTRSFRAEIEDVWASVTEPERTARWFGAWEGEAAPGRTIKVQMAYEESAPWMDMRIEACEPPRRLELFSSDENGEWRIELLLTHDGGRTELSLIHHLLSDEGVGEFGPGWEYYLDMLVAARDGTPRPTFDDYYPSMKADFEALRN
ncbi:SRPBCC family protein [Actinoplanes sp. GCM10030250]|uniref:SRPBCC family protein n=1 Tax=Actinoplanes sp. GCM10030250 TaxID=3273376 RepID=UPI0036138A1B